MDSVEPWQLVLSAGGFCVVVISLVIVLLKPTNISQADLEKRFNRLSSAHSAHVKEVAGDYAKRTEVKEQITDQISSLEKHLDAKLDIVIGMLKGRTDAN